MACANCHGMTGQGKPEGGIDPSNITWEALTKPYGVTHPSGRKHPPYTARALELAEMVAEKSSPLGVKATLASAQRARLEGEAAAFGCLDSDMAALFETEDGREGLRSFVERREARFGGR